MPRTFDFGLGPVTILDNAVYTPDPKTEWAYDEVFVFGSNMQGYHYGGAARYAHDALDAEWGVGEGSTGQCYAFPTLTEANTLIKDRAVGFPTTPPETISSLNKVFHWQFAASFLKLKQYMLANPDKTFFISKLGLGIAGWGLPDVHRMFWDSGIPLECKNAIYPMEFEAPDDMGS